MPKEATKNKPSASDGLDKAADHSSSLSDSDLALLFEEANKEALETTKKPIRELFIEEEDNLDFSEHVPDEDLLKEIEDSLVVKEIHHKKLLEEGAPTNFFSKIAFKVKDFFRIETKPKPKLLTPESWGMISTFWDIWKKETSFYLGNFGSLIDLYLRNATKTKKIIKSEIFFTIFLMLMAIPGLINYSFSSNFFSNWNSWIFSLSIISFIFSLIPIFFFFSLWFVNVNRIHASKNFHFFTFACLTISFVFSSLSIFNVILALIFQNRFNFS